jgi:hypothetical protein
LPLCENVEDGSVFRQPPGPSWKALNGDEIALALAREESRRFTENSVFGCWAGKTIVIMGLGPSLKSIPRSVVSEWVERDDLSFWAVNNAPRVAREMWKVVPPFEVYVAMDRREDDRLISDREWDKRGLWFVNGRVHRQGLLGCRGSEPFPTGTLRQMFWVDSVTAAMSIAACALATSTREKAGRKYVSKATGGKIVLLGVDLKNNEHAKPKVEDRPNEPYAAKDMTIDAHEIIKIWFDNLGIKVFNANPDSALDVWEKITSEDI